jgi:hypothetical protein
VYGTASGPESYGVHGAASGVDSYGVYGTSSGTYGSGIYGSGYYGGFFTGTQALYANGPAGGTTSWNGSSDRRYKKNIATISSPLEKVLRLRGVSFDWRRDEFPDMKFENKRQLGFIAQEIKDVLPEVVTTDAKGFYAVGYDRVVPVLVEAIKEQQKTIEEQRAKIEKLEKLAVEFAALKERISSIEALLKSPRTSSSLAIQSDEK